MLIDCHVNISANGGWYGTNFNSSFKRLRNEMDKSEIDRCVLIVMPGVTSNKFVATVINKEPNRFRGLAYINFKTDYKKQIDNIISMGFSGVKINPRIQNVQVLEKTLNSFWEYLDKKGLILMVCGYLQVPDSKITINDLQPLAYELHVKKYSNIKFILSHGGCNKVMDTFFLARSYKNFFTDISYSINRFKETSFYKDYIFLMENVEKKVLFGSDFPEISLVNAKSEFKKLTKTLSFDKEKRISSANALELFWRE